MIPIKTSLNKTSGDLFADNNPMISYTDLNSASYPVNTNAIPKIKIEDISYQTDCSAVNWQRNDCYPTNQYMTNNNMYAQMDTRVDPNGYSEPMSTINTMVPTSDQSNLVYTDLSNPYNQSSANDYQLVYAPNPMSQQNGSINGMIEPNYQNVSEAGNNLQNCDQMSAMTTTNNNMDVSTIDQSKSDCVQTLTQTVSNDSSDLKNIQFMKTIEFLRATDLLNLTLQTAELIKKNLEIQKEINNTKQLLSRFVTT